MGPISESVLPHSGPAPGRVHGRLSLEQSENALWGPDWPHVRGLWSLDPSIAHLNHGSFGAVPIPVQKAQEELRRKVEANPVKSLARNLTRELDEAREKASNFLGTSPERFVFVPNATTAVTTVLAGPFIKTDDEVLVTDQAYGAVRYAAERVCGERNARLVNGPVPLPTKGPDELVESILSGTTSKTRLAIVDHIASSTGLVFPISKIVKSLQEKGVLVMVDAAHAPGMVDVNLEGLNPDFWTGNFHKWCCSPRGSAGLWVREDHRKEIKPIVSSWYLSEEYPSSFRWLGTDDYTPYLAVPAALDFMNGLGWERVRQHNKALAQYGRDTVDEATGMDPVMPGLEAMFEAMSLVRLPDGKVRSDDDARALQARIANTLGVETAPIAWNGGGYLRLSAQVYNSPSDYDRLAEGIPELLKV